MNQLYLYIYPLLSYFPPTCTPSHSSGSSQGIELGSLHSSFPLAFCLLMVVYSCQSILPVCPTLPFICCVHKPILYICVSIPTLQMGSLAPYFQILYICINKLLLHMTAPIYSSYFIILYLLVQLFCFFLPLSPSISTLGLFLEVGLLQGSIAPNSGNWINFLIKPTFLFLRETI